jgi:hypothetical protein
VKSLSSRQLQPNSDAERSRLIRRAYLDLIGLPPTPTEVDQFVSDPDEAAFEKVIDRILDSPHYGERWARHWMDVARFAESHGYEQDTDRLNAFHYRDFLIQAFNDDQPFDEFARWQIAGDELAPNNPLALMATGFLGAGVFPTQLTEKEFESSRYDELDDMTATTGSAFLGLSIGCARCHSHKFDPIPALDYYRMAANFTTTIRSEIPVDLEPEANKKREAQYQAMLAQSKDRLKKFEREELSGLAQSLLASPLSTLDCAIEAWDDFVVPEVKLGKRETLISNIDRSWRVRKVAVSNESITFTATPGSSVVNSLRLETLTDAKLPNQGPGTGKDGGFSLAEIRIRVLSEAGKPTTTGSIATVRSEIGNSESVELTRTLIDNDRMTCWRIEGSQCGLDHVLVIELAKPLLIQPNEKLRIELIPSKIPEAGNPGRIRLLLFAAFAFQLLTASNFFGADRT